MAQHHKISFITTIYNEEKTIRLFLNSLNTQTKKPDEIIIVDGGSSDRTQFLISNFKFPISNSRVKIIIKKGNRSVGRNEAIKHATGDVIVCSDAGNILDKDWIKNITKPFKDPSVDVVAGYYTGKAQTLFQKCVIPYALVMEDKVDYEKFLPATRSVAFKKSIWKKAGRFNERYSHNEDYVFARKLRETGAKIHFAKDAIVYWIPRKTFKEAFVMMFRFALGDGEAKILRSKVLLVFARYFLLLYFIFLTLLYQSITPVLLIAAAVIVYVIWAIKKNYKYVKRREGMKILLFLQFIADVAVLSGTALGLVKRAKKFNYIGYLKQNKFLFFILFLYVFIILLTLKWGAPNERHPFPYNMDEWHQFGAVRATFKYGTPNVEGAANGTMLHFLLSGFYLVPFTLANFINPVVLKVSDLVMRERIFDLLRLNTLGWGILSVFILYNITKLNKLPHKLTLMLFIFTPVWLLLSGYFKYDIGLIFWILFSLLFLLRFAKVPSNRNFLLAAIPSSLAVAVKVSAIPLFVAYIFSYFWFMSTWKKNIRYFFLGIVIFFFCLLLFGMPDTLFGKGNIAYYLYNNIIEAPGQYSNYVLGMSPLVYLLLHQYPVIFGHGVILLFIASLVFWTYRLMKEGVRNNKIELFIVLTFMLFLLGLLPLQMSAGGNRGLVLLPFIVIIISFAVVKAFKHPYLKSISILLVILVILSQLYESFGWVYAKTVKSPQQLSSEWMKQNLPQNQVIGIEPMPIYQGVPELIQREFYFDQYKIKQKSVFSYQVIDSTTKDMPALVVMTSEEVEAKLVKNSPKKSLLERLKKEGYKKAAEFKPDLRYIKISDRDYYFSWILASPATITVYKK